MDRVFGLRSSFNVLENSSPSAFDGRRTDETMQAGIAHSAVRPVSSE